MTRVKSVLSALLLGSAALLGTMGSAQAALYTGTWDPAYGPVFPSLGWRATADFEVPDACLATSGNYLPVAGACSGFDILSASVSFYNIADPTTILETFSLDPNVVVNSISIAGGNLSGLNTFYFDDFVPSATAGIAGGGLYSFSLIFYDNFAQLAYLSPIGASTTCLSIPVPGTMCGFSASPAVGTFTRVTPVPEPETYALMLAGLGALGFVARRRRR